MKRMSPLQAGVAWGVPAGVVVGMTAMLSGVYRVEGPLAGLMDVALAFALGAVLIGGIAAFVQWRRIVSSLGDVAPPGWYESPEQDGTQWFWTGTRWTDRTRPTPPRTQTRRF
jgi:hypothetical protein